MVRVPTYDGFQVTANTLPQTQISQFQSPQAPDIVGRHAQQTGQALLGAGQQLGHIATQIQDETNRLRADDALTQFANVRTDLQTEALAIRGRHALERPDGKSLAQEYTEKLKKAASELQSNLANDAQRRMFDRGTQSMGPKFSAAITQHEVKEYETFKRDQRQAVMQTAIDQAARLPADEALFDQTLRMLHGTYEAQVREEGGDDVMFAAGVRELADQAHYTRYKAWQQDDPVAALANFQHNRNNIGPLMRDRIDKELFSRAAPLLAAATKPWVLNEGSAPVGDPRLARQPRGIRNANPGNIVKGDSQWQGQIPGNDPRFVTFATPEYGIRAMGKTLLTYQDQHNLDTIEKIVSRWAPASENPTGSYIATVARSMQAAPDARIDLRKPGTMNRLVRAMINVENGRQPYTLEQVERGVSAALDVSKLPKPKVPKEQPRANWQDEEAQTGLSIVDSLAPDQRLRVFQLARSQANQDMSEARNVLQRRAQDAAAQYLTQGAAEDPPGADDFVRAYGQNEGMRRYQEFQDTATLGVDLQRVKTLSNADQDRLLLDSFPEEGEGYATRIRNFETLQRAIQTTRQQREKDPISYALEDPSYGLEPLQSAGTSGLEWQGAALQELRARTAVMDKVAQDYGTPPTVLTDKEATSLAGFLGTLQAEDKARILGNVGRATSPEAMQSISTQLKDKNNTLAVASMLSGRRETRTRWFGPDTQGPDSALLYLRGLEAIDQNRVKIDTAAEVGIKALIYEQIEGVYQTPQGTDAAAEAAYGIYAGLRTEGIDSVDRAVRIATGGVLEHNGAKVAKPFGWSDWQFDDAISETVPQRLRASEMEVSVSGQVISADEFADMLPGARLQTLGDGTYLILAGNDLVRTLDGAPFVLEVAQ